MDELTRLLPADLTKGAVWAEKEIILPYPDVLKAINVANDHWIAILGVESFEVLKDGFRALDYSGYEIPLSGNWEAFVKSNNQEAVRFIEAHRVGENHGYILTSASRAEFSALPDQPK